MPQRREMLSERNNTAGGKELNERGLYRCGGAQREG